MGFDVTDVITIDFIVIITIDFIVIVTIIDLTFIVIIISIDSFIISIDSITIAVVTDNVVTQSFIVYFLHSNFITLYQTIVQHYSYYYYQQ